MIAVLLFGLAAFGGELRAVRRGDTVESIARSLGDEALASAIRGLNQLGPGEQPLIGRLLELPAPTVAQVTQRASVLRVIGDAFDPTGPGGRAPVARFDTLEPGDVLCTGRASYATVMLASSCEGNGEQTDHVTLFEESCVEIRSLVASDLGRASVLRVTRGSLVVADPRVAAKRVPSLVTVDAGDGVVAGVGGFRAHREEGALRVEALYRPVAVMGQGEELALKPGQGARVATGESPGDPVDLLRAGPLVAPTPEQAMGRPVFSWREDEAAFGYVLSIAGDGAFIELLYQAPSVQAAHTPDRLMLPLTEIEGHWWRIAPVDRFGFLGVPSVAWAIAMPEGVGR